MDFLGSAKVETVEGSVAEAAIDGSFAPKELESPGQNDGGQTPEEPSPLLNEASVEGNADSSTSKKPAAEQSESGVKRRGSTASVSPAGALAPEEAANETAKTSQVSAAEQAQNDGKLTPEGAVPLAPNEANAETKPDAAASKKPAAEQTESSAEAVAAKEADGESVDAKTSQVSAARQVQDDSDAKPTPAEAVSLPPNKANFEETADRSASKQPAGGLEQSAEVLAEDKAEGSRISGEEKLAVTELV